MIATIKYTDCMKDQRIVFGVLAQLKANIIKTDNKPYTIYHNITLYVEDMDEINTIMSILNKNTTYGVVLLNCRKTFKEILSGLFKEKKNDW